MSEFQLPDWLAGAGAATAAVTALFIWGRRILHGAQRIFGVIIDARISALETMTNRHEKDLYDGEDAIKPTVRRHDRQIATLEGRSGREADR